MQTYLLLLLHSSYSGALVAVANFHRHCRHSSPRMCAQRADAGADDSFLCIREAIKRERCRTARAQTNFRAVCCVVRASMLDRQPASSTLLQQDGDERE
jgi:hypothetical protein